MPKSYRRSRLRRLLDRAVGYAIQLGIGPSDYYLLSVEGRQTGAKRSTPVRVVTWQGDRWLVAPYGIASWVKNARKTGRVSLARGRKSEVVALREVQSEHRAPLLKRYAELEPTTRRHLSPSGDDNLDAYEPLAAERPVFMILPDMNRLANSAAV